DSPSAVLIRGHFVSVVTCLRDKETQERFYLLVKQRRVGTGGYFYEHPAGMCDSEADPYKVALKEVEEETGLKIQKEDLFLLYDKALYSSPGLLDEAGYFFGCEISLSHNEIREFENRITGDKSEHEHITTFLCPEKEVLNYFQHTSGVMATLLFRKIKGI
ncbi:MAG: NUDIX hydrolase, partial [Leptospiraceae bacterium]|nr:NUDIX hydrolase [Leptospiraceae bacterium]